VFKFLKGHKTYVVAAISAAAAVSNALGHPVPDFAWQLLAAAGLGAVRSALPPK